MPLLYVPYQPARWEDKILQARADHEVAHQMAILRSQLPARDRGWSHRTMACVRAQSGRARAYGSKRNVAAADRGLE